MTDGGFPILLVRSADRSLAIPITTTRTLATLIATPPLPGAAPWAVALSVHDGMPVLLVAPFGLTQELTMCTAVLLHGEVRGLQLGVVVDGSGRMASAVRAPATGRLSALCPANWLHPLQVAGSLVPCLDTDALFASLRMAA
jgi:hypothetical protein